jgi:hypothetical protein
MRFIALPCAVALCIAALPSWAASPPDALDQLMALLAQRRHGEANFQELKYLTLLDQPIASSGVLIYDAPDHLEERIVHPHPQSAVLDHGVLTLRIGRRERSVPLASYPQIAPLIESIRALLAGDRGTLERLFRLEFSGTPDRWELRLEPRAARLSATLREIDMSGQGAAVRLVQLRESNGDHSIMRIEPRP